MKKRRVIIILSLALFGSVFAYWAKLNYEYVTSLPMGYRLGDTPRGIILQLDPKICQQTGRDEMELGPNVDGYRVYPDIIAGHVSNPREAEGFYWLEPSEHEIPGYFILDFQADEMHAGLTKEEWLQRLSEHGVTEEPNLFEPSGLDELLRRNEP